MVLAFGVNSNLASDAGSVLQRLSVDLYLLLWVETHGGSGGWLRAGVGGLPLIFLLLVPRLCSAALTGGGSYGITAPCIRS